MSKENREMSDERQKAKEIAREYFQKNIDNVSTGTEGFPDTASFIYGFVEGYLLAKKELEEQIKECLKQNYKLQCEIEEQDQKIEEAREVIQFYADSEFDLRARNYLEKWK